MKKCPLCQNVFDATNDFCLNDGTPLVMIGGGAMDTPTQILSAPVTRGDAVPSKGGSPLIYAVVGGLATALIAALAYILFVPARTKEPNESATVTPPRTQPRQRMRPVNTVVGENSLPVRRPKFQICERTETGRGS